MKAPAPLLLTVLLWGCGNLRSEALDAARAGSGASGVSGAGGTGGTDRNLGTGGTSGPPPPSGLDAPTADSAPVGTDVPPGAPPDRCAQAACGGTTDGCCPGGCFNVDPDCPRANRVFVTSTTYSGNMGGVFGADGHCGGRALAAGLDGQFIALLSTQTVDGFLRLRSSRGWVRMDGKPIGDTAVDLQAGRIFYPPSLDEFGKPLLVPDGEPVHTGIHTDPDQRFRHCEQWTLPSGASNVGHVGAGGTAWMSDSSIACEETAHLYCFETGRQVTVALPPRPAASRLAFVLPQVGLNAGVAQADARCAEAATTAGLTGDFRAFLATTGASAAARFEAAGPPWYRPDGMILAASAGDLLNGKLLVSLSTLASGQPAERTYVWTGGVDPQSPGTFTCEDWGSGSALRRAITGNSSVATPRWFGHPASMLLCGGLAGLYCLSR